MVNRSSHFIMHTNSTKVKLLSWSHIVPDGSFHLLPSFYLGKFLKRKASRIGAMTTITRRRSPANDFLVRNEGTFGPHNSVRSS